MSNLYGIFWIDVTDGRPKWAMARNKRNAIRRAKTLNAQVRVLNDDPAYTSFDAPTFRVLSDLVIDYRLGRSE